MDRRSLVSVVLCGLVGVGTASADEEIDYLRQIKPLLAERCVSCHGALRQKGGLRLDAAALVRKGGDSGPAVEPGKLDESLLIGVITGEAGFTMPPEGQPLSEDEAALLKAWVAQGAVAPADEEIARDPREHWAFRRPVRPGVPQPDNAPPTRNPIDAFLAVEHARLGLTPQPEAPRHVLLRRIYLDLIGLPPTPDELRAFLADDAPDAYEKIVDRLLDDPRYGERWGRHWMDVWRYSDWYGWRQELRNSARHMWRWRDWIVESLNADKPYDEMVREMLAGDELDPGNPDTLRATGFLARHYFKFNRNTWLEATVEHTGKAFLGLTINCAKCHDHMYDPISQQEHYRFRAIFEPYQVRTDRVAGEPDTTKDGLSSAYDAKLDAPTYVFERGNEAHPDKEHPVGPGVPALFEHLPFETGPVSLPPRAFYPALDPQIQQSLIAEAQSDVAAKESALKTAQEALAAASRGETDEAAMQQAERALAVAEKQLAAARAGLASVEARIAADNAKYAQPISDDAQELAQAASRAVRQATVCDAELAVAQAELELEKARREAQGEDAAKQQAVTNAEKKREGARKQLETAQAALEKEDENYPPLGPVYPATSSGRRAALARWITDAQHPLTARVAVNHIWLRHFGRPLVPTVFDFGMNGQPPTHPELLDWLAVEFAHPTGERGASAPWSAVDEHPKDQGADAPRSPGWRMKRLHRLIVTSAAYRRHSSTAGAADANLRLDPDNRLLWRTDARRLESEAVRDSVLYVTGQLDPTRGGPELDANLGQTTYRRSLYYRHAPEKFMTFLKLFDAAGTDECYRRDETIVPQQALALANSQLAVEQSRRLAARLSEEAGTDAAEAFIAAVFERLLCRPPTDEERQSCQDFLIEQTERLSAPNQLTPVSTGGPVTVKPSPDPHQRARENLVQVLLNHHEFVTIR